ncbi:MAG TPA: Ig-like domain-containing protein [Solirubrobacteraceae bacterium]
MPVGLQGVASSTLGAGAPRFAIVRSEHDRLQASGGGLTTVFGPSGPSVRASRRALGLHVSGVGHADSLAALAATRPSARGNEILYRHGDVREWYRNGPLGLEQGFTLRRRPGSAAGWLTLAERASGGLVARRAGSGLVFVRTAGARPVLRYGALSAVDARGRSLPARIELRGNTVLLRVDDAHAAYPVRIDPLMQQGPKLTGSGTSDFGGSVALSADGNTAVIGSPGDNGLVGAAWVFTRSGSTWTQQGPQLTANDETAAPGFGDAVSLSSDGNTALIGGPGASFGDPGAAWVFTRSGSTWTQQGSKLTANDEDNIGGEGLFGAAVALSSDGNTALIGGQGDNQWVGAAWVFTRSGSSWTQQGAKLTHVDPAAANAPDHFGESVALSGDGNTALIGVAGEEEPGGAFVFTRSGSTWTEQDPQLSVSNSSGGGEGGVALSGDGNTALIGGPFGSDAAFVFTRSGSTWTQQGPQLAADDATGGSKFGSGVALSEDGNTALIGGYGDNNKVGAAWVFTRSGSSWTQLGSKLTATDETGQGEFGSGVALSSDDSTALIGGAQDNGNAGAAWVFPVDTTPPAAFDLLGPASGTLTADSHPTLSWDQATDSGSGVDHYELWIDGHKDRDVPLSACSGGVCSAQVSGALADATHTWLVKAVDAAGNDRASNETWSFTVDVTPPAAFDLVSPANGTFVSTSAPTFSWNQTTDATSGVDHYELWIDDSKDQDVPLSKCSGGTCSAQPTTALTDGPHTWFVKAIDAAGNAGVSNESWGVRVDTRPPGAFDLLSPPSGGLTSASRPTFSWDHSTDSGSGIGGYKLWIDDKDQDVPISACSGGVCTAQASVALSDGQHHWLVKAVDAVGNVTSSTETWVFTEDTTPPASFSNVAPATGSRFDNPAPTLQWTASSDSGGSGLAGYRVMIDGVQSGADLPPSATSFTPSTSLADGSHSWQVIAFDQAGNTQPGPVWNFIVDTKPPSAAITTDTPQTVTGQAVNFDASGSTDPDGAAIVKYEWDPEGTGAFTSSGATPTFQHSYASVGTYIAAVRVTNEVGLTSTASVTVTIHPAPPAGATGVSIDNAALYTNDQHVTLNVVWPALADTILVSNDGGFANAQRFPVAASIPWTLDSANSERLPKTVYVRFGDSTQTFTDDIILDTLPPMVSGATETRVGSATAADRSADGSYRVSVRASDSNSGVAKMQITANRANPGPTLPYATTTIYHSSLAPRWISVQDRAGNMSAWHPIANANPPVLSALQAFPRTLTLAGQNGRCLRATRANRKRPGCSRMLALHIAYKLNIGGRVSFTIKRLLPGRVLNGRCVARNGANRRYSQCTRRVRLPGILLRTSSPGVSGLTFTGRIGGHILTPGTYRLTATPSAHRLAGHSRSVTFKIVR